MDARIRACLVLVLAAFALRGGLEAAVVPHGGVYGFIRGPLPSMRPDDSRPALPGPRGPVIESDAESWRACWALEKDAFLPTVRRTGRAAIEAQTDVAWLGMSTADGGDIHAVTRSRIARIIVPALAETLARTSSPEVAAACLIALSRTVHVRGEIDVVAVIREQIASRNPGRRAVAALAMGITGRPETLHALLELATSDVDLHTRCFACYGLGLLMERNDDAAIARRIADALFRIAAAPDSDREQRVAAIHSLRLLSPDVAHDASRDVLFRAIRSLHALAEADGELRAPVATAIARLVRRFAPVADPAQREWCDARRREWLAAVDSGASAIGLVRSAIVALGECATDEDDVAFVVPSLIRYAAAGGDLQARRYALMALARLGGPVARAALLDAYQAHRGPRDDWHALALGVFSRLERRRSDDESEIPSRNPLAWFGRDFLFLLELRSSAPGLEAFGAEDPSWAPWTGFSSNLSFEDYEVLDAPETHDVSRLVAKILYPENGDRDKRRALADALGRLDDGRAIRPLVTLLRHPRASELDRAFAAAALGGIADPSPSPWSASLCAGLDYRAFGPTMRDGNSGVLDLP